MTARERIFVALDTADPDRARRLAAALSGHVGGLKVGLELFTACGPALVHELRQSGMPVFLDLKLHDIPNTVAGAAASASRLGASFLTVHALGGAEMIRRAAAASAEAAGAAGNSPPVLLAVTVLTSHDDAALEAIGLTGPCSSAVDRLAGLARAAGAGGLVCSPLEVSRARAIYPGGVLVVPGIRPPSGIAPSADDQARIATPREAVAAGADILVVGRPITSAPDPVAAAEAIARDIVEGSAR